MCQLTSLPLAQVSDVSTNIFKIPSTTTTLHLSMSAQLKHPPLAAKDITAIHVGC